MRAIAAVADVPPHHRTLDTYVSVLLRAGVGGEVLLVDAETGTIVARRRVSPIRTQPRNCFRQLGD